MSKDEILKEEVDEQELENVSGGASCNPHPRDTDTNNCSQCYFRDIGKPDGSYTNCAATVEDGSHCSTNDACWDNAVVYRYMKDCAKAWH